MSPFAQSMYSNSKKTHVLAAFVNNNVVAINFAAICLIMLLVVSYIFTVNNAVGKGYQIRDLETSIQSLTVENKELEVLARQSQSLQKVSNSVQMIGLVPSDTPEYVQGGPPSYALAE